MHQHRVIHPRCETQKANGVLMPRVPASSQHRSEGLSNSLYTRCGAQFTASRNSPDLNGPCARGPQRGAQLQQSLYSPEEKRRRDATPWTLVQGVLAPLQFVAFAVSLALVLRYLATGDGLWVATVSILIKTLLLYAIMITGSIWERAVFGRYLFAQAFFWEDVVSILVLVLHTAYLVAIVADLGSPRQQMVLVLAAYASYAINATQFLLKLRAARLQDRLAQAAAPLAVGVGR